MAVPFCLTGAVPSDVDFSGNFGSNNATYGSYGATIGGCNVCNNGGQMNFMAGGYCNIIHSVGASPTCCGCNAIVGGRCNHICCLVRRSSIIGSESSSIGNNSGVISDSLVAGSDGVGNQYNCAAVFGSGGGYNTYADGQSRFTTINKAAGTFRIPHPDPAKTCTHWLVHSFVEAPTEGENLYRYVVEVKSGTASLELPDYFKYVNRDVQVKTSPIDSFGMAQAQVDPGLGSILISADTDGKYNVLVMGTRTDCGAIKGWSGVERMKPLS